MTVRKLTFLLLLVAAHIGINAQTPGEVTTPGGTYRSFTPKDQMEFGVHVGLPFVAGDLDSKLGFGGGLHLRKSIDHVFSVRVNTMFAKTKNEGGGTNDNRTSDITWIGGGAQLVAALNNIRFDKPMRKILLQGFAGLGVSNFKVNYENIPQATVSEPSTGDYSNTAPYVDMGGSLGFRVSPKFNIALEYTVTSVFGKQADRLDAEANVGNNQTTYRDNLHYPSVRLNFNIGGKTKEGVAKVEPLYWANPLAGVTEAIVALEARPIYDPTDTDGDGIIDAIDDEDNSPAGARVDSKGVTLDSDGDKVADYKDKEPFSPPGYSVNMDGQAQGLPKYTTEKQVNDIVDAKLANFKLPVQKGLSDWFLPMIYFADNSYTVRYSEYEKIYQVATVLKNNSDLKIVVVGHTDSRGSEKYNNVLSYNRAKSAIEFLVSQHGIARERLILNWTGEGSPLIPVTGSNISNRRVEFNVAKDQVEMPRPEGKEAGKGTFKGNKDAGF
ncbi:MAG: OmpA family protein [Saprospiraceae bacterium]|nr:OmpA family protein [Saprospiraceae bacterium]